MNILTFTILTPLIGMVAVLFTKKDDPKQTRAIGMLFCIVTAVLCTLVMLKSMALEPGEYALPQDALWIDLGGSFQVHYAIGVDGLSGVLIFLTGLLAVCPGVASFSIKENVKGYWAMFMFLHVGVIGTFAALDLFLFYVFWEIMLLPMYFLIGVWGGPRRKYAALKFFLFTLLGSIFLLGGILVTYFALTASGTGFTGNAFSIPDIAAYARITKESGGILANFAASVPAVTGLVFWGMFVAFGVKIPIVPLHTWLPDAHVEAPTPISVILAGILLKLGAFGMLRILFPFFPNYMASAALAMAIIGMVSIVYGALVAMAQTDFKKMVAYSSVSHMGFVLLGFASMTPEGMNGAIFMLFAHGTISGLLFLVVGVVYDRAHHRDLNRFGGLMWKMPVYGAIASMAMFASLGLPGMSGFIAEITTFLGSFKSDFYPYAGLITVFALIGLVLNAAYYLRAIQKVLLGETNPACENFPDASPRELIAMVPLLVPTILLGIFPALLFDIYQPTVTYLLGLG